MAKRLDDTEELSTQAANDLSVVYMRVLEKFGGFGGFVATGLGRFEHVRRR